MRDTDPPEAGPPGADPITGITRHRELLDQLLSAWAIAVLEQLCERPLRFSELRRAIPEVTQKSLTATLRRLERNGIVERRLLSSRPVSVQYRITPLGKTVRGPVDALLGWVATHEAAVRAAQDAFDDEPDAP